MCPDLSIHIDKAESLGNIVWAGIKQLKISFGDSRKFNRDDNNVQYPKPLKNTQRRASWKQE